MKFFSRGKPLAWSERNTRHWWRSRCVGRTGNFPPSTFVIVRHCLGGKNLVSSHPNTCLRANGGYRSDVIAFGATKKLRFTTACQCNWYFLALILHLLRFMWQVSYITKPSSVQLKRGKRVMKALSQNTNIKEGWVAQNKVPLLSGRVGFADTG